MAASILAGALALPALHASPAAAAAPLPVGSGGGANLLFSDDFDGTALNPSTWQTCSWWATTTCSIETNNELELYTPNNVSVANGVLKLQARREDAVGWNGRTYNYTSGMVSSGGRSGQVAPGFTYRYGYAEARVKVPAGQGLWPAFWTLPASYAWPPEIDAMEILGNAPNVTNMTYHYLDGNGAHQSPGTAWTGPDFSADWHTFGVDWQPDAIVWFVDGIERGRFSDASAITAEPQYLLLNLAVGGNWPGSPNPSTSFPSDYLVDYVRVWDRFGTPSPPPPPPSTGYAAVVAGDGPVSHWRLGESSGITAADSYGTNPGTFQNGVTLGAPSLVAADTANRSASFDGVNDSVAVQSSTGLSPPAAVSVEAWIRPSALPAAGAFASVTTKAESYALQFNGPQLEFTTMQGGTRRRAQAPAGAVAAGQISHVVGTYDGAVQRVYVNGAQVATGAFSGPLGVNANRLVIGSWDTASEYLAGAIDEVAVYGKALTATQVTSHFNAGSATPPPPPPPPPPPAVPASPTNVKATGGDASIVATFGPANGGSAVDSYGVFAWNSAGYTGRYVTVCATCSTGTVTGLANGSTYYVTVYGHNASGWGDPGYSGWVTVAAAPGAPTNVRTVPGNASLTTTWQGPTNPGTAIDGYAVFVFDANGYTNQYAWVCATCTSGTVTGLVNGRSYYSLVYAHNPNGWGTPTVSESVVAGTPGPPTNVNATRGNGIASVTWGLASSSGPAIDLYAVFVYDATGYTGNYSTACSTCTSATVTGLTNGKTYTVWVYAHNAVGWGSPVVSSTFTPAA